MKIHITQPAVNFLKGEMKLKNGDALKIYVRYGGFGGIHPGFSLGIQGQNKSNGNTVEKEIEGIHFFVDNDDLWYFEEKDLYIKYSRNRDEIEMTVE